MLIPTIIAVTQPQG